MDLQNPLPAHESFSHCSTTPWRLLYPRPDDQGLDHFQRRALVPRGTLMELGSRLEGEKMRGVTWWQISTLQGEELSTQEFSFLDKGRQ